DVRMQADQSLRGVLPDYQNAMINVSSSYRQTPQFDRMTREGILKRGSKTSADYFKGMATAFSVGGGALSESQIHDAVNVVSEVAGQQQWTSDQADDQMRALVDVMQMQALRGGSTDPRELLGGMISGFRASHSSTIQEFSAYDMRFIQYAMSKLNTSFAEATGYQASMSTSLAEKSGRRSSTALIKMFDELNDAYTATKIQAKVRPPAEIASAADWDKLTAKQRLAYTHQRDTFGLTMRGYFEGVGSADPEVAKQARRFGRDYLGKEIGESGAQVVVPKFLRPDSPETIKAGAASGLVEEGPGAVKFYEETARGPLTTTQGRYAADVARSQGTLALLEFNNTVKAQQGLVEQLVSQLGTIAGTGSLQQKFRDLAATWNVSGASEDQLRGLQIEAARSSIGDVLGPAGKRWGSANLAGQRTGDAALRQRTIGPGKPGNRSWLPGGLQWWAEKLVGPPLPTYSNEEWDRYETNAKLRFATPEEKVQVETLQQFIEQIQQDAGTRMRGRSGPAAKKSVLPALPPPGVQPDGPLAPFLPSSPAQPPSDQSGLYDRLDRATQAMQQLAASERRGHLDVSVHDPSGRPLSRSTQRPQAIELLSDAALG
ncbi:MAG: hypothetical protein WD845_09075, partial [Pirellulales bacterium]